jgi:DNA modification methylase
MHKDLKPSNTKSAANQPPSRAGSADRGALPGTAGQTRRRTTFPVGPPQSRAPLTVGHIQQCPIARLIPYPQNARTHSALQIQQLAASIGEFGFVNPVLVRADYTVIAGHARLQAARHMGLTAIPVIVLAHLSDQQCRALAIADNQLALNAGWNEHLLRSELAVLHAEDFDLRLLAFDAAELARLLADTDGDPELADPDAAPPPPRDPVTLPGDLWIMGAHRLLCGDATQRETLDTVLAGETADMVFTDPPYNVAYQGKTARKLKIHNDALGEKFYDFLRQTCVHLMAVCRGPLYICMSSSELHTLYRAFTDAGGHWSTFVIWAKHHFTLGRADYQRQYEPILYGWAEGAAHFWCGARNQGDVWHIARPMANREHPTAKPVELVERALDNSSRHGGTVLDPFGGSGTTLIACQRRRRRARLVEIDPRYADVICQRWRSFSGQPAVLAGDGRGFEEIAREGRKVAA